MQTLPQSWVEGFDVHIVELFLLDFDLLKNLNRHARQRHHVRLVVFPDGAGDRPYMVVAVYGDVFFFHLAHFAGALSRQVRELEDQARQLMHIAAVLEPAPRCPDLFLGQYPLATIAFWRRRLHTDHWRVFHSAVTFIRASVKNGTHNRKAVVCRGRRPAFQNRSCDVGDICFTDFFQGDIANTLEDVTVEDILVAFP